MWTPPGPQINPLAVLLAQQVEAAAATLDIQIAVLEQGTAMAQENGASTADLAMIALYYQKEVWA